MNKPILVACDHAAVEMKKEVIKHLEDQGYTCVDFGTHTNASCNYPDYAEKVCTAINDGEGDMGILICGTGIGMSMAANKCRGIRAALCSDTFSARFTRLHNNANVLCMGARIIAYEMAEMIADKFLETEFEGGRHQRRIDLFDK